MGIARSTYYDTARWRRGRCDCRCGDESDLRRVRSLRLSAGWRRTAPRGIVVNHKKVSRLMREHELKPQAAQALRGDDRQRSR